MEPRKDIVAEMTRRLQRNPRDVLALIERAEAFMGRRDGQSALQDVECALQTALGEPRLRGETRALLLGRLYTLQSRALAGLGHWEQAHEAVQRALVEAPNYVEAIVQRGRIRRESGDREGAIADFDRALALDEHSASAYLGRGMARFALGDPRGAIADYDQALQYNENPSVALSNRGQAYFALCDFAQAEQDCRRALRLDPGLVRAYEVLAGSLCELGRLDEALQVISSGRRFHPTDLGMMMQAGQIYLARGQLPEALSNVTEVLRRSPDHGEAYGLRGIIHEQSGNYAAAIADLQRAIRLDPESSVYPFNLALAHLRAREPEAALAALEQLLKREPDDAEARSLYERVTLGLRKGGAAALSPGAPIEKLSEAERYWLQGEHEQALEAGEREIKATRRKGDAAEESRLLILVGSYYVKGGEVKAGEKHIRRGQKLAQKSGLPHHVAQAHIELAYIDVAQERFDQAAEHFETVLFIGRATGDRHYEHLGLGNLGAMHARRDRYQEAIPLMRQGIEIAHELGEKQFELNYCGNLGLVFIHLARGYEALDILERAQDLRRELGLEPDAGMDKTVQEIRGFLSRRGGS